MRDNDANMRLKYSLGLIQFPYIVQQMGVCHE